MYNIRLLIIFFLLLEQFAQELLFNVIFYRLDDFFMIIQFFLVTFSDFLFFKIVRSYNKLQIAYQWILIFDFLSPV